MIRNPWRFRMTMLTSGPGYKRSRCSERKHSIRGMYKRFVGATLNQLVKQGASLALSSSGLMILLPSAADAQWCHVYDISREVYSTCSTETWQKGVGYYTDYTSGFWYADQESGNN